MKRFALLFCLLTSLASNAVTQTTCENRVPDAATALKIAEAVWLPIYGKRINQKKPFVATLLNDEIWKVSGTLKTEKVVFLISKLKSVTARF